MSEKAEPSILIALDLDDPRDYPLELGLTTALSWGSTRAHVLYVVPDLRVGGPESGSLLAVWESSLAEAPKRLKPRVCEVAARLFGESAMPPIALHVRLGDPAKAILQAAVDVEADVIVVGTQDHRGIASLTLGSVAQYVARNARCAVFIARSPSYEGLEKTPRIDPPGASAGAGPERKVHVYTYSEEVPWNRPSVIR